MDNPTEAARCLNSDLELMYQWAESWLVKLNANKSEALLISRKTNRPIHPQLLMNNEPIKEVSYHKHLGIPVMELDMIILIALLVKLG